MINKFVAKEGLFYIYIFFAIAIFAYIFICDTLAVIALLITLFFVYIYRDNIKVKANVDALVSPIGGEIIAIDKLASQSVIYLDVSLFDSHILIAPKDSSFKEEIHRNGLNLCSDSFKAKQLNEKRVLSFDDIKVELISGRFNISHVFSKEKELTQYQKVGTFINGIVKIYIPSSYNLNIKLGQKIKAGEVL